VTESAALFLGGVRVGWDFVGGIAECVEQLHRTIAERRMPIDLRSQRDVPQRRLGLAPTQVYRALQGVHGLVREGLAKTSHAVAFAGCAESVPARVDTESFTAANSIAALNGICGDHLESSRNPLAIQTSLRTLDRRLELEPREIEACYERVSPRLAVWIHGLCLSEQSWRRGGEPALGSALERELGLTPVYVRYNTGRRISTNGHELAQLLEQLIDAWPTPVESIILVGHSMGGLVARSAAWHAEGAGHTWRTQLQNLICLGTPHHGSPLERMAHALTPAIQASPYVDPFAFSRRRSDGIKDLRHGAFTDPDGAAACRSRAPSGPTITPSIISSFPPRVVESSPG